MKNSFIDMTGKRIGMFTVIKRGYTHKQPSGQTKLYWECLCDCGKTFYASGTNIRNGHYLSCGCMREEMSKKGQFRKTHGMAKTRLYEIWAGMKKRCDKENFVHYSRYGGRGIRYCKEWERFEPFMEWSLANGYSDDLTLDRINNDGNYEPSNCRWVTMQEQANNTSRNRMIEIDGVTHSVSEWARVFGIKPELALHRLNRGWSVRRSLTEPIHSKNERRNRNGK